MKRVVVPVPWQGNVPGALQRYIDCSWRRGSMIFFEYLRKSNNDGEILRHLKRKHKASETEQPMAEWVNEQPTRGEVMVAAICHSRFSDTYYGQWLVLNVGFRSIADLWKPEVAENGEYSPWGASHSQYEPLVAGTDGKRLQRLGEPELSAVCTLTMISCLPQPPSPQGPP